MLELAALLCAKKCFLVACYALSVDRSVGWSVSWSVGRLFGRLVDDLHFQTSGDFSFSSCVSLPTPQKTQIPASSPKSRPSGPHPSHEPQIPASRLNSWPKGPDPSPEAKIPAPRPILQPSLKAQILASRPKSQPRVFNLSPMAKSQPRSPSLNL